MEDIWLGGPAPAASTKMDALIAGLAAVRGWQWTPSADDLLQAWAQFVSLVAGAYDDNLYEFEADRSIRGWIDVVLEEASPVPAEEVQSFRLRLEAEDARYAALLVPGVLVGHDGSPWWERGVPRYAGAELAADIANVFHVEVPVEREVLPPGAAPTG